MGTHQEEGCLNGFNGPLLATGPGHVWKSIELCRGDKLISRLEYFEVRKQNLLFP